MSKVALVTGTSTGVGLHLSVMLATQGYSTYATMRNLDKSAATVMITLSNPTRLAGSILATSRTSTL